MKILVTAFEPFGGEKVNPSMEVMNQLNATLHGAEIIKLLVPTAYGVSIDVVCQMIKEVEPDVVVSIGQASGRAHISLERVAINVDDAGMADNLGQIHRDQLIDENSETAYLSTLPIKSITEAIQKENLPASISNSAGTFVCNHLMYGVQNYIQKKNHLKLKSGFIHIPYLDKQVIHKPSMPSMSLEDMVKAIKIALRVIIQESQ